MDERLCNGFQYGVQCSGVDAYNSQKYFSSNYVCNNFVNVTSVLNNLSLSKLRSSLRNFFTMYNYKGPDSRILPESMFFRTLILDHVILLNSRPWLNFLGALALLDKVKQELSCLNNSRSEVVKLEERPSIYMNCRDHANCVMVT